MTDDRSPNATKEQMQITIDLLRARGDSAIEIIESFKGKVEFLLNELTALHTQLRQVDDQLGIQPKDRKDNAILTARRMLGKQGEGKSDEEILKMIGANLNERATN